MAHVLVVDDDAGIRGLVSRMLGKLQHTVDNAENGADALDKLAVSQFDLVITDLRMPIMDGESMLVSLRAQGDQTPVLVMSGHLQAGNGQLAFLADEFLPKPFMLTELMKKVEAVLSKSVVI